MGTIGYPIRSLLLFVLVASTIGQQCQFLSSDYTLWDLSALTNTGPNNGSYAVSDSYNGYTIYWNPCGTALGCSGSVCQSTYNGYFNMGSKNLMTWSNVGSSQVQLTYTGYTSPDSSACRDPGRTTYVTLTCGSSVSGFYRGGSGSCTYYLDFTVPCSRLCTSCSNHGQCVTGAEPRPSCSCYSGFNGTSCEGRPSASCSPAPVQPNTANFRPIISVQTVPDNMLFSVSAPMQQSPLATPYRNDAAVDPNTPFANLTLVTFSNSSTICDYPGRFWNTSNSGCTDSFASAIPFLTLIKSCGLTQSSSGDSRTYSGVMTVSRDYVLPSAYAPTFTRVEKQTAPFSIVFPMSVNASSDVVMTNTQSTASAIVYSVYDVIKQRWNVDIKTVTSGPFILALKSLNFNSQSAYRASFGGLSGCQMDTSGRCYQMLTVTIDGCSAVDLKSDLSFSTLCRTGSDCGSSYPSDVNVTTVISTASSCPVITTIGFSRTQVTSFSSAALVVPQSLFSPLQSAFFAISLASTQATLAGVNVTSVCVQLSPDAPCFPVVYSVVATGGRYQVAFSFAVSQIPNISAATKCTVVATLNLQWRNIGKRSDEVQTGVANLSAEISLDHTGGDGQVAPSNGAHSTKLWAVLLAILVLSAL